MLLPTIEKIPMTCYRLTFPQGKGKVYDVFLQDTTDLSSCVNITDEQGDQVPFDEWDNVLMFLNLKNETEPQKVFVCFVDGKPRGLLRGEKMFFETKPYWDNVRIMLVPDEKKEDLTIHNCLNYLTLFEI